MIDKRKTRGNLGIAVEGIECLLVAIDVESFHLKLSSHINRRNRTARTVERATRTSTIITNNNGYAKQHTINIDRKQADPQKSKLFENRKKERKKNVLITCCVRVPPLS